MHEKKQELFFKKERVKKKGICRQPNWKSFPPSRPLLILERSEMISEEEGLTQEGMVNKQIGKYVGKSK